MTNNSLRARFGWANPLAPNVCFIKEAGPKRNHLNNTHLPYEEIYVPPFGCYYLNQCNVFILLRVVWLLNTHNFIKQLDDGLLPKKKSQFEHFEFITACQIFHITQPWVLSIKEEPFSSQHLVPRNTTKEPSNVMAHMTWHHLPYVKLHQKYFVFLFYRGYIYGPTRELQVGHLRTRYLGSLAYKKNCPIDDNV